MPGQDADYVCIQCGPDPRGGDEHAKDMHTVDGYYWDDFDEEDFDPESIISIHREATRRIQQIMKLDDDEARRAADIALGVIADSRWVPESRIEERLKQYQARAIQLSQERFISKDELMSNSLD